MAWITTQPSLLCRVKDPTDHLAWSEFNRRYGELIVRYCRSRGLSLADAQDVRQIVLMSLARAMVNFEYLPTRGRFRSYLGRVVRNAIARYRRCPGPPEIALESDVLAFLAVDDSEADEQWSQEWVGHHLRRAMRTLRGTHNPRSLEVFERLLAGRSVDDVGEELGMKSEAVRKIKQRVRARLRAIVAIQIAEEESHE